MDILTEKVLLGFDYKFVHIKNRLFLYMVQNLKFHKKSYVSKRKSYMWEMKKSEWFWTSQEHGKLKYRLRPSQFWEEVFPA